MNLCRYKDLFGKPGEGAHSYRIFNIAIIDVLATIISAYLIYFILRYGLNIMCINYWWILLGVFLLGILLHRLFCVRTTIDKLLFN